MEHKGPTSLRRCAAAFSKSGQQVRSWASSGMTAYGFFPKQEARTGAGRKGERVGRRKKIKTLQQDYGAVLRPSRYWTP